MGKKYEYSMNFDLDPSYFGASQQAKENAKQFCSPSTNHSMIAFNDIKEAGTIFFG